jgi:hypothetical protein
MITLNTWNWINFLFSGFLAAIAITIITYLINRKVKERQEKYQSKNIIIKPKAVTKARTNKLRILGLFLVLLSTILIIWLFSGKSKSVDVMANFRFAGWMGDGEIYGKRAITLDDACIAEPHSSPTCVKFTYRPMSVGWAGVYAQHNVVGRYIDNWGDLPGMNLTGYTRLVWYARGKTGNELVEFKSGGIDKTHETDKLSKPYKDSFQLSVGIVRLEKEWTHYEMDLSNQDLSSVIGGFCWVAMARANPDGLTFYVDSITYEKRTNLPLIIAISLSIVVILLLIVRIIIALFATTRDDSGGRDSSSGTSTQVQEITGDVAEKNIDSITKPKIKNGVGGEEKRQSQLKDELKPTIFICYSHKDEKWKDRLVSQLKVLVMEDIIDEWNDRKTEPGSDWYLEIQNAISRADVAILMISADFLTSNFIRNEEIPKLLKRRKNKEAKVIPIIVEPCSWKLVKWLASMQVLPQDGNPLSLTSPEHPERAEAILADIASKIATDRADGKVTKAEKYDEGDKEGDDRD